MNIVHGPSGPLLQLLRSPYSLQLECVVSQKIWLNRAIFVIITLRVYYPNAIDQKVKCQSGVD